MDSHASRDELLEELVAPSKGTTETERVREHTSKCRVCSARSRDLRYAMDYCAAVAAIDDLLNDGLTRDLLSVELSVTKAEARVFYTPHPPAFMPAKRFDVGVARIVIARLRHLAEQNEPEGTDTAGLPVRCQGATFRVRLSFFKADDRETVRLDFTNVRSYLSLEGTGMPEDTIGKVDLADTGFGDRERACVQELTRGQGGLILVCGIPSPNLVRTRLALASELAQKNGAYADDTAYGTKCSLRRIHWFDPDENTPLLAKAAAVRGQAIVISVAAHRGVEELSGLIGLAADGWVVLQIHADSTAAALDRLCHLTSGLETARMLSFVINRRDVFVPDQERQVCLFEITTANDWRTEILRSAQISDKEVKSVSERVASISFEECLSQCLQSGLEDSAAASVLLQTAPTPSSLFSDKARRIAARAGNELFSTQHLLAAVLESLRERPGSKVGKALSEMKLDIDRMLDGLVFEDTDVGVLPISDVFATPRANYVLHLAHMEAASAGRNEADEEYIFRNLLAAGGLASNTLQRMGLTPSRFVAGLR
ncbi:MAG: Clp protease N-terminal domain-containing protein [Armatimonadota bacterium]|nr:Clp protease N-terminal domain-containing protein [Armatimonadota bacterium]